MNRRLRMLGFAAVVALALSAIGASGASAVNRHFTSDVAHTKLDAEAVTAQIVSLTNGTLSTECTGVSVASTITAATVTEITAVPTFSGCKEVGTARVYHITTTSCAYVFTATKTTTPGGVEDSHSQTHIECSTPGDHIHVKVTTILGQLNCLTFPAQTPTKGGVVYETGTKNGKHDLTVNVTIEGITYTEQGACGASTQNDGTYNGKITVSGTDVGGNPVGITWT